MFNNQELPPHFPSEKFGLIANRNRLKEPKNKCARRPKSFPPTSAPRLKNSSLCSLTILQFHNKCSLKNPCHITGKISSPTGPNVSKTRIYGNVLRGNMLQVLHLSAVPDQCPKAATPSPLSE